MNISADPLILTQPDQAAHFLERTTVPSGRLAILDETKEPIILADELYEAYGVWWVDGFALSILNSSGDVVGVLGIDMHPPDAAFALQGEIRTVGTVLFVPYIAFFVIGVWLYRGTICAAQTEVIIELWTIRFIWLPPKPGS